MSTTHKNITEKAVTAIGSPTAVSRMFGFRSPQSIFNWIIRNRVPGERVIRLCELGGGAVTPHDLRPDLHPTPISGIPEDVIRSKKIGLTHENQA
ncbi:helix-turn-helix domain-containing protein [Escherichia coli]|nr:helix-turn-helix domain-containing protein [Escherichia coli]HAW9518488.1 helix-turn-helix domain-containing protein [Escherichia coli]